MPSESQSGAGSNRSLSARDSEERLRYLVEAASEAVILHDGRVIVEVNRAMTETFGYEASEALGLSVTSLFGQDSRGDVEERLRSRDRLTFAAIASRKDGSTFPSEARTTCFSSDGGEIWGLAVSDVTARKKAEQELRDGEERFRIISGVSSDGVVLTDRGVIIYVNAAMCNLLGYKQEEMLAMSPLSITAPEYVEITKRNIMANSEEPYETVLCHKDGTRFPVAIVGKRVPLGGREVRGTTIRDLTAQRRAEETLRQNVQQQEQLRAQTSRLAELSTPVIPIGDDILVLPLIGSIDSARAQLIMEAMLEGVARTRAHTAIIDVTGVTGIDAHVADALLNVARAVRLLGAEVIVTGIRPEVARTLVVLGADLSSLASKGTLESGIAHAMTRRAR